MYDLDRILNQEIKKKFLVNKPIDPIHKIPNIYNLDRYGYIYCIENLLNGKKYIGSTYSLNIGVANSGPMASLQKRASQYIYEYNKALKSKGVKKIHRPIIQAMIDEGIENFIMYPIAETLQPVHTDMENYFINLYDTIKNGYNLDEAINTRKTSRSNLSAKEKLLRSEPIIAVNMNQQKLIFSDSMKLFADYLHTTKDLIKNANRTGKPYRGWFIFYIDSVKREDVLINNVINDQDKRSQDRHSEKAKNFYKTLYDTIGLYLKNYPKTNQEYFPNFEKLDDLKYTE